MGARVGIELSPTACRIVEIDGNPLWRPGHGRTRVRSFAVLPPSGTETRKRLDSLRRRQAAIVVWGGRTDHRLVIVTAGSYESMRAEALNTLSAAGVQTANVMADIAMASTADRGAARRTVQVSLAATTDMMEALLPLREAGIRLRTVTTPAAGLATLARLRRSISPPDSIESYIAFDAQVTCIALMRRGALLAARHLPWGFIDADYTRSQVRSRDDIASRLAGAIGEFVTAIGGSTADLGQVCVCGGLPDLRSMSALLMERLDVEVEPLDSLFGIDAGPPGKENEFRERAAELRLAWAAAADWPPAINLLRARRRQASKAHLARAAVVAGAAAGLSGSWLLVGRGDLWPAPQRPSPRTVSSPAARRGGPAPVAPPAPGVTRPTVPAPPPPQPLVNEAPTVTSRPASVDRTTGPKATVEARQPAATKPSVARPPVVVPQPVVRGARSKPTPSPRVAASEDVAEPFEAVLGTILYSPDRQLAIIDNRIVGVGDEVRGARVVDITAVRVTLRDTRGRLRRLTLSTGGR